MHETPDLPEVVATDERPAPRRRRRLVLAGLVVAVMAVGGTALGVTLTHDDRRAAAAAGPVPPSRVDPATQVVHDGDRVEGTGKVIAVDGEPVQFCAPVPETLEAGNEEAHARQCADGVDVSGVDLAALSFPQTFPGLVTGSAHLVGTWQHGTLVDVTRSPATNPPLFDPFPPPPCAPPAGGWPRVTDDSSVDPAVLEYQAAHPDDIVSIAILRASDTQIVSYVVTAGDPAPVQAALAPEVGPALCVVASRYSPAELAAAATAVDPTGPLWTVGHAYSSSGSGNIGPDGQPQFGVDLPRVTDEVLAAVGGLAPGLVQLQPWLTPVT